MTDSTSQPSFFSVLHPRDDHAVSYYAQFGRVKVHFSGRRLVCDCRSKQNFLACSNAFHTLTCYLVLCAGEGTAVCVHKHLVYMYLAQFHPSRLQQVDSALSAGVSEPAGKRAKGSDKRWLFSEAVRLWVLKNHRYPGQDSG